MMLWAAAQLNTRTSRQRETILSKAWAEFKRPVGRPATWTANAGWLLVRQVELLRECGPKFSSLKSRLNWLYDHQYRSPGLSLESFHTEYHKAKRKHAQAFKLWLNSEENKVSRKQMRLIRI